MPHFRKEDFTQDNTTRLMVVIMTYMNKPPLTQFRDLPPTQKTKFNRLMNGYITDLGENWETKLLDDFNRIVNEDILNEEFDPSKVVVKENTERNVILSTEQEEWIKMEEDEGRKVIF